MNEEDILKELDEITVEMEKQFKEEKNKKETKKETETTKSNAPINTSNYNNSNPFENFNFMNNMPKDLNSFDFNNLEKLLSNAMNIDNSTDNLDMLNQLSKYIAF